MRIGKVKWITAHKMCPRKQTTEPKLLILVSFFSGEVTSYTDISYCIHILREVCRSIFLWATLYSTLLVFDMTFFEHHKCPSGSRLMMCIHPLNKKKMCQKIWLHELLVQNTFHFFFWLRKMWVIHQRKNVRLYCKRCYFRAINFSRFAAQKHIRGLLNSRSADAHLSFLYCTKLTSFNEWYILQVYLTGQHKNKAGLRQTRVYYPFASTHMVNTQLLRVQNVHTKYRKYFRGFFEFALAEFPWNSRKLMYREYFHFYSKLPNYIPEIMVERLKKHKWWFWIPCFCPALRVRNLCIGQHIDELYCNFFFFFVMLNSVTMKLI